MIEFNILGPFGAAADGVELPLGGPAQRALLAVLVLEANQTVSTGAIIQALWGDDNPPSATGIIRTYVWRLKAALSVADDVALTGRPPGYLLEVDPDRIDAVRFQALLTEGRSQLDAGRPAEALTSLDGALGLWRGDVLADLDRFEALRPAAVRWEQMRLTAEEDRIDARLALGHHADVVSDLNVLTQQHRYRERRWYQLMTALYRSGRQADALTTYQRVRSILVDEVGVEPGPELQELEQKVLDHDDELRWRPPPGRQPGPVVTSAPRDGPPPAHATVGDRLLGRADERARVARGLDEARAGRFGSLVVSGPPGIGKSALVDHVAREARGAGLMVLAGRADEDAGIAYQPLAEAIGQWAADETPDERQRLGQDTVGQLARIVPALAGPRDRPDTPLHPVNDADRHRLFEAITRWLVVATTQQPALVVLEDLHWADTGTVLAVRHLVRREPAAGALLVVTTRESGSGDPRALDTLLADARSRTRADHLRLGGLGDDDVVDLLRGPHGSVDEAGTRFAEQLNRMTGGNPFFILETVRHLTERGAIAPAAGRWLDRPLESFGVPSAVTELIGQRLRGLPAASASLLTQASVLGEHFELAVLGQMASLAPIVAMEALEPAITARLITATGGGVRGRFAFSHSLVRHAILDGLTPSQQARLHWQAGEALTELHSGDTSSRQSEIAHHLAAGVHAGDPRAAVHANVFAGEVALASLAFEEAFTRFTTATELLEETGTNDPHLAYLAWMGVGSSSRGVITSEHDRTAFLRAAAIARQHRWPTYLGRAVIGLAARATADGPSELDQLLARALIEALAVLEEAPPSAEYCMLLAIMTVRAVVADEATDARDLAARATTAAAEVDDPAALTSASLARAWSLLGSPEPRQIAEAAVGAMAPVSDLGYHLLLRYLTLPVLPVGSMQRADPTGLESIRQQVATQPETLGSFHVATNLALWAGAVALASGRFHELDRLHRPDPDAPERPLWQLSVQVQQTVAALEQGSPVDLRLAISQFVSATPTAVNLHATLALLSANAGDRARATHEVDLLRKRRRWDQLGWAAPSVLRALAETSALVGLPDLAAELLPVLLPYTGQLLVPFTGITIEGAADRAIGQVHLAMGHNDEAIARFEEAIALERSFVADDLAARTLYWHGRALLARGRPGDDHAGHELAHRAGVEAKRLGMAPLEAAAAQLSA